MKCIVCEENVIMEWIDGNIGFKLIMKYLVCILKGEGVCGMMFFIVFVGKGQYQDVGVKMIYFVLNILFIIVLKLILK